MGWLTGSSEGFALEVCRKDGSVNPLDWKTFRISMSRDIYASKAEVVARIDGRNYRSDPLRDVSRQINRLIIGTRDDLNPNSTAADWARSDARFAKRVANGEVQTIASNGLRPSTLELIERAQGSEIKQGLSDLNLF